VHQRRVVRRVEVALAVGGRDPTAEMRLMCITEEGAASEGR
jgi:hypothetical protein